MTAAKIPSLFLLCAVLLTGCRSRDTVFPQDGAYRLCRSDKTIQLQEGSDVIAGDIESIGIGRYYLIFHSGSGEKYGILIYASGTVRYFKTEQELLMFIKRNYPDYPIPEWDARTEL